MIIAGLLLKYFLYCVIFTILGIISFLLFLKFFDNKKTENLAELFAWLYKAFLIIGLLISIKYHI